MKKLKSLETVESCILESKEVGLLSDFENRNNYNINKNNINNINSIESIKGININGRSKAMCFSES